MFKKGYKQTKQQRDKIALALKGNKNALGKLLSQKHPSWKGDDAQYGTKHSWVRRNFGKQKFCSLCGKKGKKISGKWNIHWANKSGKYSRERKDWLALCTQCHNNRDFIEKSKKMKLAWKVRKLNYATSI